MTSTAVVIGNATYSREQALPCCKQDAAAMQALIEATGRFDKVCAFTDLDADRMREAIRECIPVDSEQEEIFFYFSGHGAQVADEFYYCGSDYDGRRPNATGLSHSELLDLLRAVSPETLIMVIDACFSGALLVKEARPPKPVIKEGFRNVLQFSSSLDDQTSLGGDPLSSFTRAFLEAAVRKEEGTVYYTDLVNYLRDEFLENEEQTPFFVNQGTGREVFVGEASTLTAFRQMLSSRWSAEARNGEAEIVALPDPSEPPTAKELLMTAEARMGGPEQAKTLIAKLFDALLERFDGAEFADYFELEKVEHSDFREPTVREFMIRILSRETRHDQLVTAEIERKEKKPSVWESMSLGILASMNREWTDVLTLELNCKLERAQLKVVMKPKYRALQQLVLVLSCAPSLERCYIFEVLTQHPRTDWDTFDSEGRELTRRWYKVDWDGSVERVIENASEALAKAVREHIENTAARISQPKISN